MVDMTENEIQAIMHAGTPGGEYLDSIKKTDLAVLTEEEWYTFIECIVTGYQDKLFELNGKMQSEPIFYTSKNGISEEEVPF